MPSIKTQGIAELSQKISALATDAEKIAKAALYEGAGIVAEAVKAQVRTIPIDEDGHFAVGVDPLQIITVKDREECAAAVGIARFDTTGGASTAIGFQGYLSRREKKYPGGVPIPMVMRSVESGSSVRAAHPFIKAAVGASRGAATNAMIRRADEEINKITKE